MPSPEYILVILGHVEDLDGDEFLEVCNGGKSRYTDKLSTQLWQLLRIGTLQHKVDLLIKPVRTSSQEQLPVKMRKPVVVQGGSRLWGSFLFLRLGVFLLLLLLQVLHHRVKM